jgi:excisionase family DNA binding protein
VTIEQNLLDWDQVAERLGTTPRWVREARYRGDLPFVRVGKLIRFRPSDIDAFIAANLHKPEGIHPLLKGKAS